MNPYLMGRNLVRGLLVVVSVSAAAADVPRMIHYQGKLRESGGTAVEGAAALRFRLYGSPTMTTPVLFDETHGAVGVANGLFSVLIGSQTMGGVPDSALDVPAVYLGVTVNGGTELAPRTRLVSNPHAIKARSAEQLVLPGTYQPGAIVDGNGRVGVGTQAPSAQLDVFAATGDILQAAGPAGAPTYSSWTQATSAAPWAGRFRFAVAAGAGVMWVLGGETSGGLQRDVWSSANGAAWTLATSTAAWSSRSEHTGAAFDGRLWVLGGNAGGRVNDVWHSAGGAAWTFAGNAPWGGRSFPSSLAHGGRLWLIGGREVAPNNDRNDVWYTTNGSAWTAATTAAPWMRREIQLAMSHAGSLWIMGGSGDLGVANDVWSSADGSAWTQATSAAPWSARGSLAGEAFDGRLWVLGGNSGSDVWSSTDGASWTQVTSAAGWSGRNFHRALVNAGSLWVLGGDDGSRKNDVWSLGGVAAQPLLKFTSAGRLGLGVASPSHPLQLSSGAHVTAGGTWTDASSREYKIDVAPLSLGEAEAVLDALAPVTFRYKADPSDDHVGFIAEAVPDLVATPDRKGLSPMDVTAVLTRVVQEQREAIRRLEAEVARQRAEIEAIKD